jgi:hypothetical protein
MESDRCYALFIHSVSYGHPYRSDFPDRPSLEPPNSSIAKYADSYNYKDSKSRNKKRKAEYDLIGISSLSLSLSLQLLNYENYKKSHHLIDYI